MELEKICGGSMREKEWLEAVAAVMMHAGNSLDDGKSAWLPTCKAQPGWVRGSARCRLMEEMFEKESINSFMGLFARYLFQQEDSHLYGRILLEEKSLEECCRYVTGQAKKKADRQKADSLCETDEIVFGWVEAYYNAGSIEAGELFPASQAGITGAHRAAERPVIPTDGRPGEVKKKQGRKAARKGTEEEKAAGEKEADVPGKREGQLSLADFGAM